MSDRDVPAGGAVRRGAGRWLAGYRVMTRWELTSLRLWLWLLAAVQILSGVGMVLGIALFFRDIPPAVARYVSTGVPVINLLMVGLILGPQLVADQKVKGSYEYLQALPVPKSATAMAWYTVTLVAGIPSVVIALVVAHLRYGIDLRLAPTLVPAVLLTSFAGTMMGYALGHATPNPMTARLTSQLLIFAVFGFAPILFPVWQMPHWLGAVNYGFPFRHMADIVRDALGGGTAPGLAASYLIVAAWAAACAALCARVLGRRR